MFYKIIKKSVNPDRNSSGAIDPTGITPVCYPTAVPPAYPAGRPGAGQGIISNGVKAAGSALLVLSSVIMSAAAASAGLLDPEVGDKIQEDTNSLAGEGGFDLTQTVGSVIEVVIKGFLGFLGIIFIILIIYAGYNWMTAQGEEQKVQRAQDTIQRAVIGLIIIIAAYAITYFVFNALPMGAGGGGPEGIPH